VAGGAGKRPARLRVRAAVRLDVAGRGLLTRQRGVLQGDSTETVHLKGLVKFKTNTGNTGNTGTARLARNTDTAGFTRPRKATAARPGGCS
jgi:hypothetical protein